MNRFVLFFAAAVIGVALLSAPPAHADAKCGNDICQGSATTQVHLKGNLMLDKPVVPGTSNGILVDGGVSIFGNVTVGGNQVVTGNTKTASLDAGYGLVNGDLEVLGQIIPLRPFKCGADLACGTVALSSGTPSTATKTVESGSTCFCWPVGNTAAIAAGGCAASVSSTIATFTGPNTVTTTVGWLCVH